MLASYDLMLQRVVSSSGNSIDKKRRFVQFLKEFLKNYSFTFFGLYEFTFLLYYDFTLITLLYLLILF